MSDVSILEEILGSKVKVKTLLFLLEHPIYEYTTQDIVKNTGLSRMSVSKALYIFLKYGIVIKTRRVGRIEFYQINLSNPFVVGLLELNKNVIKNIPEYEQITDVDAKIEGNIDDFERDIIDSVVKGLKEKGYSKIGIRVGPGMQISIDAEKDGKDYCAYYG